MTFEEEYDPVDIEDYLAHYGRKGMKWYQHIFGKFQSHSKYSKDYERTGPVTSKNREFERTGPVVAVKKQKATKNYKKFSDEELRRRINRLKNEKEYLELTRVSRRAGERAVVSVLNSIGKGSLQVIETQTKNLGNRVIGEVISDFLKNRKK